MFAVIRKSYLYLKSLKQKNVLLDYEEWGVSFVCSDKMRLIRNTVPEDGCLPG